LKEKKNDVRETNFVTGFDIICHFRLIT